MQILPTLLRFQKMVYHTTFSKGKLIAIVRNEQAILRQQEQKSPLKIEVKDASEFVMQEKFSSGGKGLIKINCILRSVDHHQTELEARIIPHKLLKLVFQLWRSFILLALASSITCALLGLFYNPSMFVFLWMIIPSGAMIFFIAIGVRRLLNQQIKRYQRILEVITQAHQVSFS